MIDIKEIFMDYEANTMYYKISNKKVARTKEIEENFILVDYAEDGTVVGVEILNMKKMDGTCGFSSISIPAKRIAGAD